MFCHIVFSSEYSFAYHQLIKKYFGLSEHQFLVRGKAQHFQEESYTYENAIYVNDLSKRKVLRILESSRAILVSGLFSDSVIDFFYKNSYLLEKTSWFVWGGDVYGKRNKEPFYTELTFLKSRQYLLRANVKTTLENIDLSLKCRFIPLTVNSKQLKRIFIIRTFKNIIGVLEKDYESIQTIEKTKANYIYGFHPLLIDWNLIKSYSITNQKNKQLNILVGNSATQTNQHSEAFQLLEKFKNFNIKIYCPLVYGDKKYRQEVIEQGIEIFSNKFIPIIDAMPPSNYTQFLTTMDVAIMNHNRQQGLGNIFTLLLLGKKIYMSTAISSYNLMKEKSIKVYDINEIKQYAIISDLECMETKDRYKNREIVIQEFSEDTWYKVWQKIFYEYL